MKTDKSILIEQLEWALTKVKYSPKPQYKEIAEHIDYAQSLVKKLATPVVMWRCLKTKKMKETNEVCFKKNSTYKQIPNEHRFMLIDESGEAHDVTEWRDIFNAT